MDCVCRAITFINYNMPIRNGEDEWIGYEKYCTTGFFDFMYTKSLEYEYKEKQLQELWNYGIECITRGEGRYTHQSIFCFSRDDWNSTSDKDFWSPDKHREMLLTFVVFVQTRDYIKEADGLGNQCRRFRQVAEGQLGGEGCVYTYGTVDKNDFVICIRSSSYKKAVDAIMSLHGAGCSVVYSYSVFGIAEKRQLGFGEKEYDLLNEQKIDSISLKGVTNSVRLNENTSYTLDQKYFSFCRSLVRELYRGVPKSKQDYKIYDILGDNDFRLIARMVPLGNLIRQLGKEGMLSYYGVDTQFTFFSTNLVLNTRDESRQSRMQLISNKDIAKANQSLQMSYKTELCASLKDEVDKLLLQLKDECEKRQYIEKLITACYGIYQLLQSLTTLETAPTKKYDFFSIYYPLETIVHILKTGDCEAEERTKIESFAENDLLYEFIHRISMTLHGTLRTDIQFFQIRDFNATLHYAPAKLRAYYTFFVFMLSAHIKEVSSDLSEVKKHSYIFCPGMFKGVSVKQLCRQPMEEKRLMLITVPERYLYFPKNLLVILGHEVGHLAGERLRKRKERHKAFLECSYRVLCLELTKYAAHLYKNASKGKKGEENFRPELRFCDADLWDALLAENELIEKTVKDKAHMNYSGPSMQRIEIVYKKIYHKYGKMCLAKYGRLLLKKLWSSHEADAEKKHDEYSSAMKEVCEKYIFCDDLVDRMLERFSLYRMTMLPDLLQQIHYLLSEPVSDILAILILGLDPSEYLYSVADERKENRTREQFGKGIIKVRIALVVKVMEQLRKEFKDQWIQELLESWRAVYDTIIPIDGDYGTMESDLALEAFEYVDNLGNKLDMICDYQSPINQDKDAIEKKVYDYLNDEEMFQKMSEYLLICGKEYIHQISRNNSYKYSRGILRESFRKCAGGTPIELMEQIDIFLYRFEEEWKNEYFSDI